MTDTIQTASANLTQRPRRLRLNANIRRMVRETTLTPDDFIYPLFVRYGEGVQNPIASMPGQFQLSVDRLPTEIRMVQGVGYPSCDSLWNP